MAKRKKLRPDAFTDELDAMIAENGLRRRTGREPTAQESALLRNDPEAREAELVEYIYSTIPQKNYIEWTGRQCKVLQDQERLYGLPIARRTISLAALAPAIHLLLERIDHDRAGRRRTRAGTL